MIYYLHNLPICWKKGKIYDLFSQQIPDVSNTEEFLKQILTEFKEYTRENDIINSIEDFIEVYHCSKYWQLYDFPLTMYIYGYFEPEKVIKFLNEKDTDLLSEIQDNSYLIKNKEIFIRFFNDFRK